jgi:large subunit ribosomal protein L10
MKREDKEVIINELSEHITNSSHFYLADISTLNAADTSDLRRKCFEKDIQLILVKNTLLRKALEKAEGSYDELYDVLKNSTSIMFTNVGNVPAKLIKEFRKKHDKPVLKAAYVEESVYIGDEQLEALANIKSKEELIGDIVLLLQSPVKNVLSQLQSGGNTISGLLKALEEKNN